MESELICLDTSVLIDYFRKTNKKNSFLAELTQKNSLFAVSIITVFEIYCGSNKTQSKYWDRFFEKIQIIPFDINSNIEAISIYKTLKKEGNLIDMPDLFISATAKAHNLKRFLPILEDAPDGSDGEEMAIVFSNLYQRQNSFFILVSIAHHRSRTFESISSSGHIIEFEWCESMSLVYPRRITSPTFHRNYGEMVREIPSLWCPPPE